MSGSAVLAVCEARQWPQSWGKDSENFVCDCAYINHPFSTKTEFSAGVKLVDSYQEPMRAEVPKERPTAVLCVQLSARYVQIRQTAKIRNSTP